MNLQVNLTILVSTPARQSTLNHMKAKLYLVQVFYAVQMMNSHKNLTKRLHARGSENSVLHASNLSQLIKEILLSISVFSLILCQTTALTHSTKILWKLLPIGQSNSTLKLLVFSKTNHFLIQILAI